MSQSTVDQFVDLLTQMQSSQNVVRKKAEKIFYTSKDKQPNETLQALLMVARNYKELTVRSFCFLLLKRLFNLNADSNKKKPFFLSLSAEVQNVYKNELLKGVEKEPSDYVRKLMCDVISNIATILFLNDLAWEELIQWIFTTGNDARKDMKFCCYHVVKEISGYLAELPFIKANVNEFAKLLVNGLTYTDAEVKVESLEASTSFIQYANELRNTLQVLIEPMFSVIPFCLEQKDNDKSEKAIQGFIEMAEIDPGFFKPRIDSITETFINLARNGNLTPAVNRLSAEFLVTLAENKPKMCKNNVNFIKSILGILLQMMLAIPDITVEEWEKDDDYDDIENFLVAEEYLDRLSLAVGGEVMIPLIWEIINQFKENQNWKYRHTALKSISMIAEGCVDVLSKGLNDIVNIIVNGSNDPDPRVRYASIHALGQLSTDFGPKFQNHFHENLVPLLIKHLNDPSNRIKNHAGAASVNFCEKFDSHLIEPYLKDLIGSLYQIITKGEKKFKEQSLLALSVVSQCAKKKFIPYYGTIVPSLIDLFKHTSIEKEYRDLRGKTMLCITSICMAVGKDVFKNDSQVILPLLQEAHNQVKDPDDPQEIYYLDSWSHIANCLKTEFTPYLENIIPGLIETAEQQIEFLVGNDDDEEDDVEYQVLEDDTKIGINTTILGEKIKAIGLLCDYASSTKEGFFPYVEKTSSIIAPLVDYLYNEDIRTASFYGLPYIIKSARLYITKNNLDRKPLSDLFNFIYQKVFASANKERDHEVLLVALDCVSHCIHAAGENCLDKKQMIAIFESIKYWIGAFREIREDLKKTHDPDSDGDYGLFINSELSKESDFIAGVAEIVTATFKNHKNVFLSVFSEAGMIEFVLDLLKNPGSDNERQLAICIFDDIVEHGQAQSHQLFSTFIPIILEHSKSTNPAIRQAITFGMGIYAQYGGTVIHPFLDTISNTLLEIITAPDSRNKSLGSSTDNAISSIGRIIQYQPQVFGNKLPDICKMWLSWLPLEIDIIEARVVHKQLCTLIQENNKFILGENFSNLPAILSVFADIYTSRSVKDETNTQILEIMKNMKTQIPDIINAAFNSLPPNKQERLMRLN